MTAIGRDYNNDPVNFKTETDGSNLVPFYKMQPADVAALSGLTDAQLRANPVVTQDNASYLEEKIEAIKFYLAEQERQEEEEAIAMMMIALV